MRQGIIISSTRMEASLSARSNSGIMDDEEEEEELRCMSSFSSEEEEEDDDNSRASLGSSSEELQEDATSSTSSLSLYPPSSSSSNDLLEEGPLFEMSSLVATLPFKRGLSKFFEGKSQSFTSLSSVSCLEDLAKPERPYKKKLKSSKSYAGGLDGPKPLSPTSSSRAITKKSSKGSFSSLRARRHNFVGNRPPIPPQRSSCPSSQILLFASRA